MREDRLSNMKTWLGYDDIAILPEYSEIRTRKNINLASYLDEKLNIVLQTPIIASPMNTICETEMCVALDKLGGLGILHRYNTIEQQVTLFKNAKTAGCINIGAAVGVSGDYLNRAQALINAGCNIICIDVAHGHNILTKEAVKNIRDIGGNTIHIMAGNVGTLKGARFLDDCGVNSIRVGISTGCFVPDSLIRTKDGLEKIQDIKLGTEVYTHTGELKPVINTISFNVDEELIIVNNIKCTKNHEFYVINKDDAIILTDDNIKKYAYWVRADELDIKKHILVELE